MPTRLNNELPQSGPSGRGDIYRARKPEYSSKRLHNHRIVNTNERSFSRQASLSFLPCCRAFSFISAVLRLAQSRDRGITHLRSVAFAAIKLSLYAASFILGELYPLEGRRIYSRCYARRRYFRREAARHLGRTVKRLCRKLEPMFLSTWYFVCALAADIASRYLATSSRWYHLSSIRIQGNFSSREASMTHRSWLRSL